MVWNTLGWERSEVVTIATQGEGHPEGKKRKTEGVREQTDCQGNKLGIYCWSKDYCKVPKFWDARNLCHNLPKIQTKGPNLKGILSKWCKWNSKQ